jgi:hypothetical protein
MKVFLINILFRVFLFSFFFVLYLVFKFDFFVFWSFSALTLLYLVLGLWLGDKINKLNSSQTKVSHIFIIELIVSIILGFIIYGGIYLFIFSAILNR